MKTPISAAEAVARIPDGATIMIGGFLNCGRPPLLIEALLNSGKKNLTLISNDTGYAGNGIGALITNNVVSHVVASHIGTNADTQKRMLSDDLKVDLVPQGTLAEQVRAGGYGLGGVLTKTGLGTIVADKAETVTLNGQQWLYMPPLRADFALVFADRADPLGNLAYTLTELNFNPAMAMAADTVFAEARSIVPAGAIAPDDVRTPGIVIDHLIGRL